MRHVDMTCLRYIYWFAHLTTVAPMFNQCSTFNYGIIFIVKQIYVWVGPDGLDHRVPTRTLESITWATYNVYGGVIFAYAKTASEGR